MGFEVYHSGAGGYHSFGDKVKFGGGSGEKGISKKVGVSGRNCC